MNYYSLKQFINETQPSLNIIDYLIKSKYNYLLVINQERQAKILLDKENYSCITEENGVYYIHTKKPIVINNKSLISVFEICLSEGDDVLGFFIKEDVVAYCDKNHINTSISLTSKLIFSPQLANFLLDKGFKIIHLKPHNTNNQSIYVFTVEKGFYEAIQEYRNKEWN